MQIVTKGVAGTMESSDIIVRIEPAEQKGIELTLTSAVIRDTLAEIGVEDAVVNAVDKGALDCTVAARVKAAAYRAAQSEDYAWRTKQ